MRLSIDNMLGAGAVDYSSALDLTVAPRVLRKINQPAELRCSLAGAGKAIVAGARVILTKANGNIVFTGYLTQAPQCEYLGWGEAGAVYRYQLVAESDEILLDQKVLPNRAPFVGRSAGSALRQLAQDLLSGAFDTSAVQDIDTVAVYQVNRQKNFSWHAGEIAQTARASYRAMNGALMLAPVGSTIYAVNESDGNFAPAGLKVIGVSALVNDLTVIGLDEPQAYVRDYFVGDGLSLRFFL